LRIPAGLQRFLSEFASHQALRDLGFPVVEQRLCQTEEQMRAAFRDFDGAKTGVAIKACSAELPHKSEFGLVEVNVRSEAAAAEIFHGQWRKVVGLKVACDGIIVARMLRGQREFVLGARMDPQFGPVIMLGDGGRYVEALKDFTLLLPPFSEAAASSALQRLRIAPLYPGVRGEPAMDIAALARLAVLLGDTTLASAKSIASIDLNPVIVGATGEGAWIADALIERAGRATSR
jgi:acetate---CoA ligase (ADP-forming)